MQRLARDGYARLAPNYYRDPAVRAAGLRAELVFVRGLAVLAGNGSGNHLTEEAVNEISARSEHRIDVIERLVAFGLWERDQEHGGYRVINYHKWNPTPTQIAAVRARDAAYKRMQRRRLTRRTPADANSHHRDGGSAHADAACPSDVHTVCPPPPKGAGGGHTHARARTDGAKARSTSMSSHRDGSMVADWRRERVAAKPPDLSGLRAKLQADSTKYRRQLQRRTPGEQQPGGEQQ